jgi:plasmid stabilization system protein ParE
MSRNGALRRAAVKDVADAFKWYEQQQVGLRQEFVLELEATLQRIQKNPELARLFHRQARKVRLRRFPFIVVYVLSPGKISIVSVFHCSRNPRTLRQRLK